jgi:hypothetical protein
MWTENYLHTMPLLILAAGVVVAACIDAARIFQTGRWPLIRFRLVHSPLRRLTAVWGLLFTFAFLVSSSVGKRGSNYNYLMELNLAACPLASIALCRILAEVRQQRRWAPITTALLLLPLSILPPILPHSLAELISFATGRRDAQAVMENAQDYRDYSDALKIVRESSGPVFSEDMWLLVKSGKQVPAEPAIIRDLAATSQWDERPFVLMLQEKRFSTIVLTSDLKSSHLFTPAVAQAVDGAYQQTRQIGTEYRIYEPRPN